MCRKAKGKYKTFKRIENGCSVKELVYIKSMFKERGHDIKSVIEKAKEKTNKYRLIKCILQIWQAPSVFQTI